MAKNYCTIIPSKGKDLFLSLKKEYGYNIARQVFLKAIHPKFIADHKKTLVLDKEGVPTRDSLLSTPYIKNFLGDSVAIQAQNKKFPIYTDTQANYNIALEEAKNFNENSPERDRLVAYVDYTDDGKIKTTVTQKNSATVDRFNDQYSSFKLNQRLAEIFSHLGVTVGNLSAAEVSAGRVGVIDFNNAKGMAQDFLSMIRVANNMEGAQAISEEFSHLIIGLFRNEPLVKRTINALAEDEKVLREILGDEYEDTLDFQDGDMLKVAEEVAGQLLRKNLLEEALMPPTKKSLFRRFINYIKSLFKDYSLTDVQNAITDADASLGELAKSIMSGTKNITQEDLKNSSRNAQFNALSNRIDRNIEILKTAARTEIKRGRIVKGEKSSAAEQMVTNIMGFTNADSDTVEGLLNYAKVALGELQSLDIAFSNIGEMSPNNVFSLLRRTRMYLQSYTPFIDSLTDAYIEEQNEEDNMFEKEYSSVDEFGEVGEVTKLGDVYSQLSEMSRVLKRRFNKVALESLTKFYEPFIGEGITIPFGDKAGETIKLTDLLKEAQSDISFLDKWLDSMAESSDITLQLVDAAVKKAKNKIRLETIDDIKSIQRLMMKADSYGITDFDWMFEKDSEGHKSGNYIGEINYAQFELDLKRFEEKLEEKYGKNPAGKAAQDKIAERQKWLSTHALRTVGTLLPNAQLYRNTTYDKLSPKHKEILEDFLRIKSKYDAKLPSTRVSNLKAIQIRKAGNQRLWESLTSPSTIFSNIKESIASDLLDRSDDDTIFGEKTKKGLTDFAGEEFLTLPVLYTNKLENPDDLSTDVFSTLMAYAFNANTYEEMDKIVDPLEITRAYISEQRKVRETRGGNPLVEKIETAESIVTNKIFKQSGSNIEQKLKDFLECQVYMKYLKDEGTFDVFGKKVNVNKATSALIRASSLAQLGFNWLANIANVGTGLAMQNIEAAAGEYFGARELLAADKDYTARLTELIAELGSRIKTNKLDLFGELFDIKQDFNRKVKRTQKKNLLQRLFGENIAFLGQDGGDHWLYYRTAIAMAKKQKVRIPKPKNRPVIKGLTAAKKVVEQIIANSAGMRLNEDEKFYVSNDKNSLFARVTSVIGAESGDFFETVHADGRPNNWITPSTNIGTGFDELTRDFFSGLLTKDSDGKWQHTSTQSLDTIYPNATNGSINDFLNQLEEFKNDLDSKGMTVVSRDIVARGKLKVRNGKKLQTLNVAGTLDLLVYDKKGNFYIYDMKTYRGNISDHKKQKWAAQTSLYKKFLEEEYGIQIKGLNIIPIKVSYPTPKGESSNGIDGIAEYTTSWGNQLLIDGHEFKEARPRLGATIELKERKVDVQYELLRDSSQAITDEIDTADYTEMPLWDALQIKDKFVGNNKIKEMYLPEGTLDSEGNYFDIGEFGRKIAHVNQHLFGVYNDEDMNAANRVAAGRLIMLYRKWMKPQFNKRFQKGQASLAGQQWEEGYYRTVYRMLNELIRGKVQLSAQWGNMTDHEKANVKRALTEIVQWLVVYALANWIEWPDDKERPWLVKFAEYMAQREAHELGGLTPSPTFLQELLKTVKQPSAALGTLQNAINLTTSLLDPTDWTNEISSGPYKGMSTLEKNFIKAPLPLVPQYRQIDKFIGDLDTSIGYYARPY